VVLLPAADREGTEVVAQRVRDAFTRLQVAGPAGPVAVRGSVGAAALGTDAVGASTEAARSRQFFENSAEHLVHEADLAMYVAKGGAPKAEPEVRAVGWVPPSLAESCASAS
jgi:GGDEF domain-containing protein